MDTATAPAFASPDSGRFSARLVDRRKNPEVEPKPLVLQEVVTVLLRNKETLIQEYKATGDVSLSTFLQIVSRAFPGRSMKEAEALYGQIRSMALASMEKKGPKKGGFFPKMPSLVSMVPKALGFGSRQESVSLDM